MIELVRKLTCQAPASRGRCLRLAASSRSMTDGRVCSSKVHEHEAAIESIVAQVKQFQAAGQTFRISHGSTNSTRDQRSKGSGFIDTGSLARILAVDPDRRTALVEPNVPMDRLVEATLPHNLIPPVVMEFPGITVGGGYSGTSGESSSFRHGFFDRNIKSVEIILANGKRVKCSDEAHPDLFRGAAGAMGTLGVVTCLELDLRPAPKYVEATYLPVRSMREAVQQIDTLMKDTTIDYLDGIMFSENEGAIIIARGVQEASSSKWQDLGIQSFSNSKDPWFYLHVADCLKRSKRPHTELVPLAEYLFRYDRGGFWVGTAAFKYFHMPFNKWTRHFLDDFLHTRMLYSALHASRQKNHLIIQDLAMPFDKAEEFVEYTNKSLGIYPLWLCPLKQSPSPTMHPHLFKVPKSDNPPSMMLNIGLWGWGPRNRAECKERNLDLEKKVHELGGMKWLYAETFYSREEFWSMFDYTWYLELRQKYHATTLPDVYDKLVGRASPDSKSSWSDRLWGSVLNTAPFGGLYGIKKAIDSKSYIAARASKWKHLG